MRDFDRHYGHAELVNRRARLVIIFVLLLLGGLVVGVNAFGSESRDIATPDAGDITPPVSVLAANALSTTTSQPPVPAAASSTSMNDPVATTTTPVQTTTTSEASGSTNTTHPATTTTRASTTTTRPTTTTTTTTTTPPTTTTTSTTTTTTSTTTTTTSTTTTTTPPTTTTTVPVGAWFPILNADAFCDGGSQIIRWSVSDPDENWSKGWQMVIDGDNRGLFPPGTIVTNDGGPAVSLEVVDPGKHTLTLDVHWERLGTGNQDRGFGTFSITVNADSNCHD